MNIESEGERKEESILDLPKDKEKEREIEREKIEVILRVHSTDESIT